MITFRETIRPSADLRNHYPDQEAEGTMKTRRARRMR